MLSATRAELAYSMAGPMRRDQRGIRFKIHHIPKTAGTSLYHELKSLGLGTFPVHESCMEPHRLRGADAINMIMLRLPVSHVLSLFMHCKYYQWARAPSSSNRTPAFIDRQAMARWQRPSLAGLDGFLRHYLDAGTLPTERFGCYDPRDMQARALTCSDPRNWATHRLQQPGANDAAAAVAAVGSTASLQLVGLTEFFHESICLVIDRLGRPLPSMCDCASPNATTMRRQHVRYTHGVPRIEQPERRLSNATRQLVAALTRADERVYAAGVERMVRDLVDLEARTATRVLCDSALRRLPDAIVRQHASLAARRALDPTWPTTSRGVYRRNRR